jgi:hypothetical protein
MAPVSPFHHRNAHKMGYLLLLLGLSTALVAILDVILMEDHSGKRRNAASEATRCSPLPEKADVELAAAISTRCTAQPELEQLEQLEKNNVLGAFFSVQTSNDTSKPEQAMERLKEEIHAFGGPAKWCGDAGHVHAFPKFCSAVIRCMLKRHPSVAASQTDRERSGPPNPDALVDALVKLGWHEEMFRPSTECPRFLHVIPFQAGLGHRFMGMAMAVIRANATRSTLVFGSDVWEEPITYSGKAPVHYGWFGSFSGLSAMPFLRNFPDDLVSRLDILRVPHATTSVFEQWDRKCYSALSEHQHWCNPIWCSEREKTAWSLVHPFFSTIFSQLGEHKEQRNKATTYRIAWHVRTGEDIRTPMTSATLMTALQQINAALPTVASKRAVQHVIYSWDNLDECSKYYCAFVRETEKMQPPVQFVHSSEVLDLMRNLVDADSVVSTGSSLAYVATALTPASQIVVSFLPKEYDNGRNPYVTDFYNRGDYVYLSYEGRMTDADATRLKSRFAAAIGS